MDDGCEHKESIDHSIYIITIFSKLYKQSLEYHDDRMCTIPVDERDIRHSVTIISNL